MNKSTSKFEIGAEVQHKTGGQMMIYVGDDEIGNAICTWMAGGKKHSDSFVAAELKPYVTTPTSIRVTRG